MGTMPLALAPCCLLLSWPGWGLCMEGGAGGDASPNACLTCPAGCHSCQELIEGTLHDMHRQGVCCMLEGCPLHVLKALAMQSSCVAVGWRQHTVEWCIAEGLPTPCQCQVTTSSSGGAGSCAGSLEAASIKAAAASKPFLCSCMLSPSAAPAATGRCCSCSACGPFSQSAACAGTYRRVSLGANPRVLACSAAGSRHAHGHRAL